MTRDHLDTAIDRAAARLVAAPGEDAELLRRIVAALPPRSSKLRWLIPQLAAIGAITSAVWLWRWPVEPERPLPAATVATPIAFAAPIAAAAPEAFGTARVEPRARLSPVEAEEGRSAAADFDRALNALVVGEVATPEIPALPEIGLAPIQLREIETPADLPRQ